LITLVENLPFVIHRFFLDCWNSTGLLLLEKPLFYVVTLTILHVCFDITELVSDSMWFLMDLFDDIGLVIFLLLSFFGQFMAFMRERRVQREFL